MERKLKLRRLKDFRFLFRRGRRAENSLFRLVLNRNGLGHGRFAFIAPASADKRSTVRHKLARRAREWLRKRPDITGRAIDAAVIFKKESALAPRKKFYEELEKIFDRSRFV